MYSAYASYFRDKRDLLAAAALLLPLCLLCVFMPTWYGADEEAHFEDAKYVALTGRYPGPSTFFDEEVVRSLALFPLPYEKLRLWGGTSDPQETPLFSVYGFFNVLPPAEVSRLLDAQKEFGKSYGLSYAPQALNGITYGKDCSQTDCTSANYSYEKDGLIREADPQHIYMTVWQYQQPPLYYYLAAAVLRPLYLVRASLLHKVLCLRLLSVLFALASLPFLRSAVARLHPEKQYGPFAALIVLFPTVFWSLARVSNDALAFFAGSVGAYVFARLMREKDAPALKLVSAYFLLAVLSKPTLFALAPVLALAPFFNAGHAMLARLKKAASVAAGAVAGVALYAALSLLRASNLTGTYGGAASLKEILRTMAFRSPSFFQFASVPIFSFGTWLPLHFQEEWQGYADIRPYCILALLVAYGLSVAWASLRRRTTAPDIGYLALGSLLLASLLGLMYALNAQYLVELSRGGSGSQFQYVFTGGWYFAGIAPLFFILMCRPLEKRALMGLAGLCLIVNIVIYDHVFLSRFDGMPASLEAKARMLSDYSLARA